MDAETAFPAAAATAAGLARPLAGAAQLSHNL